MERAEDMKKNAVVLAVICLFYLIMAVVTVGSRRRYLANTPKVHALQPTTAYTMVGDQGQSGYLVPKACADGALYVLERREKNGQLRVYARKIAVEFGDWEQDGFVMVLSGLSGMDVIISEGMDAVEDGGEVLVENADEIKLW